jgi:hypothetical protein
MGKNLIFSKGIAVGHLWWINLSYPATFQCYRLLKSLDEEFGSFRMPKTIRASQTAIYFTVLWAEIWFCQKVLL